MQIYIKLAFALNMIVLGSCARTNPFDYEPGKIALSEFQQHESKSVNASSLKRWLNNSDTTGAYRKFPYVAVQAIQNESDARIRSSIVNLYKEVYKSIKDNPNRKLNYTVHHDDWSESSLGGRMPISDVLPTYLGVPNTELELMNKNGRTRGKSEIEQIVEYIKSAQ
jgi:dGTP triphosphohydrolase